MLKLCDLGDVNMSKESYVIRYGKFEVSPEKMETIGQEDLNEEEIARIRKFRENFMKRMRLHFAEKPEV